MTGNKRILVAARRPAVLRKIEALLAPAEVAIESAPNGQVFETLASRQGFDLLFAELPLFGLGLGDFLKRLRRPGSASPHAPVVLLARQDDRDFVDGLDPTTRELVTTCATVAKALKTIAETLELGNRSAVRLFAETEMIVDSVRLKKVCQTENISPSGMLLRTSQFLPVGAVLPFSLSLPDDVNPIHGRGEVVRYTGTGEPVSGMGVRFLGLDGDGNTRLRSFLRSH